MITRFPEMYPRAQNTELQFGKVPFALYKMEKDCGKRAIFLTEHMLIFVIKGKKQLHFPDRVIEVNADNIILLKRGIHVLSEYVAAEQAYESLAIFIADSFIKRFMHMLDSRLKKPEGEDFVVIPTNELLNSFKLQYIHYFGKQISNLREILNVKLQELFLLLIASPYKNEVLGFLSTATADGLIDLEYVMRQYLLQPLNGAQLANLCGRSLAAFKRDFNKTFGCAPRQWINRERLAQARILLNNTDDNIAGVCYACGFENVSHFIKLYKRQYGITPNCSRTESVII